MVAIGEGSKKSIRDQLSGMGSNMVTIRPSSNTTVGGGARLGSSGLQTLKVEDAEAIKKQAQYITAVSPRCISKRAGDKWRAQLAHIHAGSKPGIP